MLSDTVLSLGGHTVHISSFQILLAGALLLGIAGFLLGLSRGRRVTLQRSATTDDVAIQLARIAEALERIAGRPADRLIEEASREVGAPAGSGPRLAAQVRSIFG